MSTLALELTINSLLSRVAALEEAAIAQDERIWLAESTLQDIQVGAVDDQGEQEK